MSEFLPIEKADPIRQPSTANLLVDSNTRAVSSGILNWANFSIQQPNALMNGYFTRIGVTEVVLNWEEPNIVTGFNDTFTVIKASGPTTYTVTLPQGIYTVAQALDKIVSLLNAAGTSLTWSITGVGPSCGLTSTGTYTITATNLSSQLGFSLTDVTASLAKLLVSAPDLRYAYALDFVCDDLTYNQALKDTSTGKARTVLCRWYMSWDNPVSLDAYGFPIYMGYTPFTCRRLFSPPKQIRWMPNMPIGNLNFQVYPQGILNVNGNIPYPVNSTLGGLPGTSYQMTLQVSEV